MAAQIAMHLAGPMPTVISATAGSSTPTYLQIGTKRRPQASVIVSKSSATHWLTHLRRTAARTVIAALNWSLQAPAGTGAAGGAASAGQVTAKTADLSWTATTTASLTGRRRTKTPMSKPNLVNQETQAAYRDASWLSHPDTRTPKRGHILLDDGRAACGLVAMMCDAEPAEGIPECLRCRRPGCRDRWPEVASEKLPASGSDQKSQMQEK